jgi:D-sedoheptulose 7-phosphate isomerase
MKAGMQMKQTVKEFQDVLLNTQITTITQQPFSLEEGLDAIIHLIDNCRAQHKTVYVIGNGGSAAIASHVVVDLLNTVKMKAMSMLNPAVTTCLSNDYGYEYVYEKQLAQFIEKQDILIAISSSGKSKNILNGVEIAKLAGAKVITFSGFLADNPLRQTGDYNLWLDSSKYGPVEIGHAFILHHITDQLKMINPLKKMKKVELA